MEDAATQRCISEEKNGIHPKKLRSTKITSNNIYW